MNAVFVYALARAASMTRVRVHAWVAMSNHLHLAITDTYGERPRFMELLNTELAKAASALIGRWGGFWESGRSYSAVELLDRRAVVEKLAYILANPVTARLVRRAQRWPGATSARLVFGDVIVARRPETAYYQNSCQPESYELRLEAPPRLDPIECNRAVRTRVRELEREMQRAVRADSGRFLGEKRVLRQDPHDSPSSWEKRRGRNPTFSSGDKWARIEAAQRNREWQTAYRSAWEAWRAGVRDVLFPAGTWLMSRLHGCSCLPAPG